MYSKAFDFVEINSTFYNLPTKRIVESWRERVPSNFEFSVRSHKDLTHTFQFEPNDSTFNLFEKMISLCYSVRANVLHFETPATMKFTASRLESIKDFLKSVNTKKIRLAWEIRRKTVEPFNKKLMHIFDDFNIIHCVDISKGEKPMVESNILYTRLFGLGNHNIYQYTDEELRNVHKNSSDERYEKSYLVFHGAKMYKDTSRLEIFKKTGKFPKVTKSIGKGSLEEVLREDIRLPATKEELIHQQGWKVIDITDDKRVYASELLEQLPKGTYNSINHILNLLK
jgi:uncharacterized protein YecE (DUF72 family)